MEELDKYTDLLNHTGDGAEGDDMAQFLKMSSSANLPEGKGKKAIWEMIESKLDEEQNTEEAPRKINPWILSGVAAAILLLVVFILTVQSTDTAENVHIIADAGAGEVHSLPDGSTVNLNASSSIFYKEDWGRTLTLAGEAFFEVTEGSTFTVKTRLGDVQVLGTSFNVFARDSIFEVSCKTGLVKVSIPEKSVSTELQPGQSIAARLDTVYQTTLELDEIGNWTTGEFYFSNRPIREVFDEIERQYKTTIDVKNGDTLRFTGYFFKDSDINSTLDLVCLPLGLQFEKQATGYIVSRRANDL